MPLINLVNVIFKKIIICISLITILALAHPHDFMSYTISPIIDNNNNIIALHQKWFFSPYTAAAMTDDIFEQQSIALQKKMFQQLQMDVMQKLQTANYYTFATKDFGAVTDVKLFINNDGILQLDFKINVKKPQRQLQYKIYEPTFFIMMIHDDAQIKEWANGCQLTIKEATPSEEDYINAAMLDVEQRGAENLGAIFSESGLLRCQ